MIEKFINEAGLFLGLIGTNFSEVGALFPTSSVSAAALCRELRRDRRPKRILEVGAGTGAITQEIIKSLGAGDEFLICELNPTFAVYLRERFAKEAAFKAVAGITQIYEGSVLDLPLDRPFDYIVSTLPFNNCSLDFVDAVFVHYQQLLKPAGVLSYIEYVGGRTLKQLLNNNPEKGNADAMAVQHYLAQHRHRFEFRRELIARNIPPAWIHYLRFGNVNGDAAQRLGALADNERLGFGMVGVDSDAVPFLAGLLALISWLRLRSSQSRWWQILTLLAGLIALFFRDPKRQIVQDERVALAASDGVVLKVEKIRDARFGDSEWLRIAVFLSILDVHVNRSPVGGTVVDVLQEDGGFASANTEAAEHNVAQYTVISTSRGWCVVAQRSGLIARRIVNRSRRGMVLAQGDKFGLIRFGSRTDVYLPAATYQALVEKGDRVWGGETAIASVIEK